MMKLIFGIWRNTNVFYKLILPFLVYMVRHIQVTNQIAEFFDMQYQEGQYRDSFLHVEKYSSKISKKCPVLVKCAETCPKYP